MLLKLDLLGNALPPRPGAITENAIEVARKSLLPGYSRLDGLRRISS